MIILLTFVSILFPYLTFPKVPVNMQLIQANFVTGIQDKINAKISTFTKSFSKLVLSNFLYHLLDLNQAFQFRFNELYVFILLVSSSMQNKQNQNYSIMYYGMSAIAITRNLWKAKIWGVGGICGCICGFNRGRCGNQNCYQVEKTCFIH